MEPKIKTSSLIEVKIDTRTLRHVCPTGQVLWPPSNGVTRTVKLQPEFWRKGFLSQLVLTPPHTLVTVPSACDSFTASSNAGPTQQRPFILL